MTSAQAIFGATRATASRWRVLGVACCAHVLHDGCADMLYLLLPFWQRELALSLAQIGFLKTLYSGAMAVCQIPAGRLSEWSGERIPLVAGTVLTASAVFAFHWSTTPVLLGLLLVLGGLGASVQHPSASTLVSRAYAGPRLRAALGTYNFAGDLGKVAIPGLVALVIMVSDWRHATMVVGLVGFATAAVLFVTLEPKRLLRGPDDRHVASGRLTLPERIRRPGFAALSTIGALDSATRTGFLTLLPFLLTEYGAGAVELGTALSLAFAGGAAGKFACGVLAARIGVLRTVLMTESGTVLGIFMLLILPLQACLALMPAVGALLNGTSSVLYGSVPELAPAQRESRAFGLFYTITIGAGAIAPAIYGAVADSLGLHLSLVLVAAALLLVLPMMILLRPVFARELV